MRIDDFTLLEEKVVELQEQLKQEQQEHNLLKETHNKKLLLLKQYSLWIDELELIEKVKLEQDQLIPELKQQITALNNSITELINPIFFLNQLEPTL